MKTINKLLGVLAITLVVLSSCSDTFEPTPTFQASNATITASASATTVSPTKADSLAAVVTFNWNDPGYAVGLANTKFSIVVAKAGENFALTRSKVFTGVLTGSLLGKEINGMALQLGATIGTSFAMEARVVASQANFNEPLSSDVIGIAVTPYGDLSLSSSATSITTDQANQGGTALTLNWSTAFNGFDGVRSYELQHAAFESSFANPTVVSVTGFSESITHLELNNIALGYGIMAGTAGKIEFRAKAVNEKNVVQYSNTVIVEVTPYRPLNSVGIIGDATAGGWNTDSDLYRPSASQPSDWTTIIKLEGGKQAKFRADDDWATNWGDGAFPSGTATQGGPNIPIPTTGFYKVNFNAATGAYSFELLTVPSLTSVSIIGSGTPGGWSDDTQLTQSGMDANVFFGTVTLTDGEAKFRKTGDWGTNWGATSFPSGNGQPNGPNIPVTAGTYYVRLNIATGEYYFGPANRSTPYDDIGIIGDATPGGWSDDTNLIRNPSNPFLWSKKLTLTDGFVKFRANNSWDVNWGTNSFPSGVATAGGDNIPMTAGTYQITFNTLTGEYSFIQ